MEEEKKEVAKPNEGEDMDAGVKAYNPFDANKETAEEAQAKKIAAENKKKEVEAKKPTLDELIQEEEAKEPENEEGYSWYNPVGWAAAGVGLVAGEGEEPVLQKTVSTVEREEIAELEDAGFSDETQIAGKNWKIFKWYVMKPCNQMSFDLSFLNAKDNKLLERLVAA